ncbi:hypothetical protein ACO0LM_12350 [Undibacterium sp. Di26W]|uniref:hypothetical protein n=1 Tax=Undibacterium sp. Di26W TaxID=3413035 RepID=UPI003BF45744
MNKEAILKDYEMSEKLKTVQGALLESEKLLTQLQYNESVDEADFILVLNLIGTAKRYNTQFRELAGLADIID